ncbi:uncharacterized protein HMPREF1120_08775 [Exophiala dermatitidis NIH/UT8656]|uniref:Uncharacterized protein n=1 Tax=Exophiala dermatitidis (strain ATCC 34100 / CBS 525.76 / NIH/UT8656) TaxID=858893 RepID=H6CAN4_EXODN|nr:uncharacterized protein HMPREF1120_08775 [Exophiala dermatitidis NIH/UT8656]EHY60831.1 hypothetical protein HMPREF1120_08775 [Exophiala dermatitidis NIH/UT8656]
MLEMQPGVLNRADVDLGHWRDLLKEPSGIQGGWQEQFLYPMVPNSVPGACSGACTSSISSSVMFDGLLTPTQQSVWSSSSNETSHSSINSAYPGELWSTLCFQSSCGLVLIAGGQVMLLCGSMSSIRQLKISFAMIPAAHVEGGKESAQERMPFELRCRNLSHLICVPFFLDLVSSESKSENSGPWKIKSWFLLKAGEQS